MVGLLLSEDLAPLIPQGCHRLYHRTEVLVGVAHPRGVLHEPSVTWSELLLAAVTDTYFDLSHQMEYQSPLGQWMEGHKPKF